MAKIIYTPIGKPSKKTSRGLKRATAYLYIGNAKVPGNHLPAYLMMVLSALGLVGLVVGLAVR